jgi:hypothetical protein
MRTEGEIKRYIGGLPHDEDENPTGDLTLADDLRFAPHARRHDDTPTAHLG